MKTRNQARRIRFPESPHDERGEACAVLEFDCEQEAPGRDCLALSQELAIPGLQEYLRDISDLDLRAGPFFRH